MNVIGSCEGLFSLKGYIQVMQRELTKYFRLDILNLKYAIYVFL